MKPPFVTRGLLCGIGFRQRILSVGRTLEAPQQLLLTRLAPFPVHIIAQLGEDIDRSHQNEKADDEHKVEEDDESRSQETQNQIDG